MSKIVFHLFFENLPKIRYSLKCVSHCLTLGSIFGGKESDMSQFFEINLEPINLKSVLTLSLKKKSSFICILMQFNQRPITVFRNFVREIIKVCVMQSRL